MPTNNQHSYDTFMEVWGWSDAGTGTELFFDFGTPPLIFRVIPERLPSLDNNLPMTSDGPSDVPLASRPWQSLQVA
jgi:hypothetical protein